MRLLLATFLLVSVSGEAFAQSPFDRVGDEYRITLVYSTESKGDGSSSSSNGSHEYVERIDAVRDDGVERVFDLPPELTAEERLLNWQFPVRVLDADDGTLSLLNREEMVARRDLWLADAKISPEACGSWYFTWNAFQVECDPDAVLETISHLRIQPARLAEGELLQHSTAIKAGVITLERTTRRGKVYTAQMTINPAFFKREEANSDVVVGEIMKEPISFADALAKREGEKITGIVSVGLHVHSNGQVWKRVTSTKLDKVDLDGTVEQQSSLEEIERRSLPSRRF